MCFWTYGLRNTWLETGLSKVCESPVSEDPLRSNMGNGPKHCSKLNNSIFTISVNPWESNSGFKCLSVICKILRLFVNPLNANDKYSLLNRGNLLQNFQMQFFRKEKLFLIFFFIFSNFRLNIEHFLKKVDGHSWCILELTDNENRGYIKV